MRTLLSLLGSIRIISNGEGTTPNATTMLNNVISEMITSMPVDIELSNVDNPYTNNEKDYLRLSGWSFHGKTKSVLNNYLRYITTNYKTSFLLPHDYELPTFNYPEYVLPPVPYNMLLPLLLLTNLINQLLIKKKKIEVNLII